MTEENRVRSSHIPKHSFLFEKVVPASLIAMAFITVALIVFAAAVLLGLVRF